MLGLGLALARAARGAHTIGQRSAAAAAAAARAPRRLLDLARGRAARRLVGHAHLIKVGGAYALVVIVAGLAGLGTVLPRGAGGQLGCALHPIGAELAPGWWLLPALSQDGPCFCVIHALAHFLEAQRRPAGDDASLSQLVQLGPHVLKRTVEAAPLVWPAARVCHIAHDARGALVQFACPRRPGAPRAEPVLRPGVMMLDHEGVAVAERHAAAVPVGTRHPVAALRKVAALPRVGLGGRVTGAAHDGSAVVLIAVGIAEA